MVDVHCERQMQMNINLNHGERIMFKTLISRRVMLGLLMTCAMAFSAAAQQWEKLYDRQSQYTRILVFNTPSNHRVLNFDNSDATQSEINLLDTDELVLSYAKHIMTALPLVENPKRVLVVGLGGGCMQRYMRKLMPDLQIDTAELDPMIPDVAKQFFLFKEDAKNKVYVMDGRKFIEQQGEPYDIIFLDAFGPDSIPYALSTQEFMQSVKKRLTPKGIVAANLWYDESNYYNLTKTYQSVYADTRVIRCANSFNMILIGFQEKSDLDAAKWVAKAKEFEKKFPTRLNLPTLVDKGYTEARVTETAKILKDADKGK